MLFTRFYYSAKPWLPWRLRVGIRRVIARRKRLLFADVWPIKESAGRTPDGWPGWPKGKQFAFVLTHDVESQIGLDRVRPLAELEMQLGFRSSFNFIPEGEYQVPKELRHWLTDHGFEVGVHDLYHDGKLYDSREAFSEKAKKINHYLKEWDAVGFRSGFMLHRLDWLHDLDIQYDASTFDTDPFEPQPDGVDTIFPFWVRRSTQEVRSEKSEVGSQPLVSTSPGYVELPYTLPQDSTLFLLFGEKAPDVWKTKLDWITAHGGLALLPVHPDYVNFQGARSSNEYPVSLYRDFLEKVRDGFAGRYWHLLPRELAVVIKGIRPRKPPSCAKRVCMIAYSIYESDNRVRRYAETLVAQGDSVDVLSLGRNRSELRRCVDSGVNVIPLQSRQRNEKRRLTYATRLFQFWWRASLSLSLRHLRKRYDLVHVHNVPDFLVFAAWLPKLFGAGVILDIHDIVPEFYASKFGRGRESWGVRLLRGIERASARFADHVIVSNHLWHGKIVARSAPAEKCSVVLNHVDERVFFRRPRTRTDDRIVIIFPGGLQWHQGVDIAVRSFAKIVKQFTKAEFHIYGDGDRKGELVDLAKDLGLNGGVQFHSPVPISQVPQLLADADIGVVPKRADGFGNEAYSTKIMEFMAQGIPVVASRTKIDTFYFDDSCLRFFDSADVDQLADAIVELLQDAELRRRTIANGLAYVARNSWQTRQHEYLDLVQRLTAD